MVFVTSMATVPGTLFPDASARVNVSCCPACGDSIVERSIGWLKVADGAVAVTTFLLLLMLVGTPVASPLGLVKITAGATCAIKLLCRPHAHPARSSTVDHVRDFNSISYRFTLLPSSIGRFVAARLICRPQMVGDRSPHIKREHSLFRHDSSKRRTTHFPRNDASVRNGRVGQEEASDGAASCQAFVLVVEKLHLSQCNRRANPRGRTKHSICSTYRKCCVSRPAELNCGKVSLALC